MQGLMKVLSAEEKAQIALFYSAQPVTPAGTPSTPGQPKGAITSRRTACVATARMPVAARTFLASPASSLNTCGAACSATSKSAASAPIPP
jgi:hypothetical protein